VRALVQRVREAWVTSAEDRDATREEVGRIGAGLVALVGVTHDDDEAAAHRLADKLYHLRILDDGEGGMNLSCADTGGQLLVVSQFTLYGDTRKGRRPSFVAAARPEVAEPLVEEVVQRLRSHGATVATGRFRTHMEVHLVGDGPVTVLVEV
jgi:D-aminoacyl-tRNA deacylase